MNTRPIPHTCISSEREGAHTNKEREFEICTLEWMEKHRPLESEVPHRLPTYEMIWVTKGAGILSVDLHKYLIREQTLYFLAPGQFRRLETPRGLEGYYIALSPAFLHLVENQIDYSFLVPQYGGRWQQPLMSVDQEMQKELEDVVRKMLREYSNYFWLRAEILRVLLKIFMIYLSRKMKGKAHQPGYDKEAEMLCRFMELLKKHYATKKLVSEYADELCVTPNYLNSIIKKISGYPASHHIQQYIILEAKRQAMYSGLRMKEIAYSLGFEDYAHFSKFFKNYSGMSFTSYKKQMHGVI